MNKKFKILAIGIAIVSLIATANNNIYAGGADGDIIQGISNKKVYYEGETIETTWQFVQGYETLYTEVPRIMTDFEMSLSGAVTGSEWEWETLELKSQIKDANFSNGKLYYIQILPTVEKIKLLGGQKIATSSFKIPYNVYEQSDDAYDMEVRLCLKGTAAYSDDSVGIPVYENEMISIMPYTSGDFNRDHEVDFFDIAKLISSVYDEGQANVDWRQKESITSITSNYTTNEDYDIKTAEIGFIDIIYLIKHIYD